MESTISRLLAFVVVALMSNLLSGQDDNQNPEIDLPMRVDIPVVEFDLAGGFRMPTPPGFDRTPRLRIYANGKVVCGRNTPQTAEVIYQMPRQDFWN